MESGLLRYVRYEDRNSQNEEGESLDFSEWKFRAAAVTSLSEIYRIFKYDSLGALAHEALSGRKNEETHPHVLSLIATGTGTTSSLLTDATQDVNLSQHITTHYPAPPHRRPLRRISYLFKYICIELAETYAESQSRYAYLRQYLQTTDRKGLQWKDAGSLVMRNLDAEIKGVDDSKRWEEIRGVLKSKGRSDSPHRHPTLEEVRRKRQPLEPFPEPPYVLSTAPYHQNYKIDVEKHAKRLGGNEGEEEKSTKVPPPTPGASLLPTYSQAQSIAATVVPQNGTANKRKLFNAPRPQRPLLMSGVETPKDRVNFKFILPQIVSVPQE
ncbi:hypothetical protein HK097_010346 [Rhizophlyctis rosea]|uniref:Uncharacterized protein n=1 Tax=Rhizophlyctis rosea TaxID=64517 RepID=A0AAD5SPB7_9FUNG|nr:hypothetical protein HK097_010346 [Rhizophlyctis rosea]